MTRRRNTQQRKNPETAPSPSELLDMDINSMSERQFRLTIIQVMARINDIIEFLRTEMKTSIADVRSAISEIQSNLNSLTVELWRQRIELVIQRIKW